MPDKIENGSAWDALTDAQLDTVHEHLAQLVCEMVDVPKDPPSELVRVAGAVRGPAVCPILQRVRGEGHRTEGGREMNTNRALLLLWLALAVVMHDLRRAWLSRGCAERRQPVLARCSRGPAGVR
jgi:hypothetical protein